ncbi:type IV pilin protein [Roseateles saccharophilus]|uniref:Type IV pilus assembly protein PilE n=1 Tax=Roseateles saccharophilus TaxID=304 RepID=A0A4R3UTL9_ROSSA|nr:type IV pilin protein [Roseateles saccharophilus]MDG0832691.1 prepilin-type N-terminal cleavage/methylation domain-containing protein [Roseateles saccharophilus]TCU95375.1 type IV pilus assembly protein PilE [Roseateles saccharophilus]
MAKVSAFAQGRAPWSATGRFGLRGFTLIELMIAVVVVAILAAVAFPAYQSQLRRSRRSDAIQAIAQAQQIQERWRVNNPTYATNDVLTTAWPSGLGLTSTTTGGYYTLSIGANPTSTAYTMTATAVAGTSQASDTGCSTLTVSVSNGAATMKPTSCWSK